MTQLRVNDKVIANPQDQGFDQICERIRNAVSGVSWVEQAYGRAFLLPERLADDEIAEYPHVFLDRDESGLIGEYQPVMPNDEYANFVFSIGKGEGVSLDRDEISNFIESENYQKRLDVIAFLNLNRIDGTKDYIYTEELTFELIKAIESVRGIAVQEYFNETVAEVYADFTLREISRDILMYPYAGIRIVTLANYKAFCE